MESFPETWKQAGGWGLPTALAHAQSELTPGSLSPRSWSRTTPGSRAGPSWSPCATWVPKSSWIVLASSRSTQPPWGTGDASAWINQEEFLWALLGGCRGLGLPKGHKLFKLGNVLKQRWNLYSVKSLWPMEKIGSIMRSFFWWEKHKKNQLRAGYPSWLEHPATPRLRAWSPVRARKRIN